ncbi:MAG: PDZ domain-containing protein [Candidatus Zixiibacteriota bacterium]|nr:MAG: PDZ domain-containing protein [candidate division Zixibacteria bacterium]
MKRFLTILSVTVLAVAIVFSFGVTKSYKSSKYAWLGVVGQSVDRDLAYDFDLPVKEGAYINDVLRDSPAEEAGLEEDDIIVSVEGTRVRDYDDLVDIIEDHKPGDEITLTVMRDDEKIELKATLDSRPRRYRGKYSWYSDEPIVVPRIPKIPSIPKLERMVRIDEYGGSYIGVSMMGLTRQLGEYFGVEKGRGVLISEVEEDSPAEKAGLKAGDVIIAVDGDKVWDFEDVMDAVTDKDEGETLTVTVMREKSEQSFDVTVEEREDDWEHSFRWYDSDHDFSSPRIIMHGDLFDDDLSGFYFDSEDFEDDMEELAEDMEELEEELRELELDRGKMLKEDLKEELEELREELEELEEEIY